MPKHVQAKATAQSSFMSHPFDCHRLCSRWLTKAAFILIWLLMAPVLKAEVRDIRQEIAQESAQYRAAHFSAGRFPPKHDWRQLKFLQKDKQNSLAVPGGVGYGYYFDDSALLWTNSTIADYYVVAPNILGQSVSYLYLTSTCRAQLGTESLVEYDGDNQAVFWVYDWAQPVASRWQVHLSLPLDHPEYLTKRSDEFAITRQMIHVRNGTYFLGFNQGQFQWQNRVQLFNFNRGDWDLIYSYNYGTTSLTDNLYASSGNPTGFWGPIVETFDTNYTNINPIGFDLIRLYQDGNPVPFWLNPTNSYVQATSPWQLLNRAPNTSFTVTVNATNPTGGTNSMGTLCVTANTNAASFTLDPAAGLVASGWVITPLNNRWDKIMVGLSPGQYAINFNPLSGLVSPAPQLFTIASNSITTVSANYYFSTPSFQSVTAGAGLISLSWSSTPGLAYQLQYKTNLTQPNWIDLGSTLTASNTVLSTTDSPGSDPLRFYRVQQQ